MNRLLLIMTCCATLVCGCHAEDRDVAALRRTGEAFVQIAEEVTPAVVSIRVEQTVDVQQRSGPLGGEVPDLFEYFFGPQLRRGFPQQSPRQRRRMGQGSGFIITEDGYILTNNHVVNDADSIIVTLQDGREFDAELVGTDPETEVALIRIEDEDSLPIVKLGNSDALQVGEWAIAVGNPFGLQETVTVGIISATGRSVGITDYENFIQTDAAINPGNSGGPLLNINGEVVGINTAIYSQSGGYMGIGFAIPINMAMTIKEALIKDGKVQRSLIGIYLQRLTPELAESFGLDSTDGILISQVSEDSAASEAGIQAGDIILELNEQPAGKLSSFRNRVAATPPGTDITLTVLRDGERKTFTLTTRAKDGAGMNADSWSILETAGFEAREPTEQMLEQMRLPLNSRGVVVTEVERGGPAWTAGLREGMLILSVNRMPAHDAEHFHEALEASKNADRLLLLTRHPRYGSRYLIVPLDK